MLDRCGVVCRRRSLLTPVENEGVLKIFPDAVYDDPQEAAKVYVLEGARGFHQVCRGSGCTTTLRHAHSSLKTMREQGKILQHVMGTTLLGFFEKGGCEANVVTFVRHQHIWKNLQFQSWQMPTVHAHWRHRVIRSFGKQLLRAGRGLGWVFWTTKQRKIKM